MAINWKNIIEIIRDELLKFNYSGLEGLYILIFAIFSHNEYIERKDYKDLLK